MSKIPTAEELFLQESHGDAVMNYREASEFAIKFAKFHLQAQQEAILKKVKIKHDYVDDVYDSNFCDTVDCEFCSLKTDRDGMPYAADIINIDKESIINAYPLDNIK